MSSAAIGQKTLLVMVVLLFASIELEGETMKKEIIGKVLDLVTKKDRNGRPIEYANVLWGGRATPSLHAVTRLDLKVDSE